MIKGQSDRRFDVTKKVVILGAGYAGLSTLKILQKRGNDIEITLIDRNDYHYEATDFHEVAAGAVTRNKITYPIMDVVDKKKTQFIQGTVSSIDRANKQVLLEGEKTVTYDYLVVALGFVSETFGIKGAEENALPMDDVDSSEKIYEHIKQVLAGYQSTQNESDLTIAVAGAGFTGIELVGALAEQRSVLGNIAGVDGSKIRIVCIDFAKRLLPMFPEDLTVHALDILKERGVEIITGKGIAEIKPGVIVHKDADTEEIGELAAGTIIWTTGVSGSPVISASGWEARRNRVSVSPTLQDTEYPEVYVIGDVSAAIDPETNRPYPTTAQISLVMGETTGENILSDIAGTAKKEFSYNPLGTVASLGNTRAVGIVGEKEKPVKGYLASVLKKIIMDKSLYQTGGVKEVLSKGRFDLWH